MGPISICYGDGTGLLSAAERIQCAEAGLSQKSAQIRRGWRPVHAGSLPSPDPRLPGSFPGLEGAPLPSRQLLQGPLGAHLRARDPLRGPGTEWGHPKAPLSIGVR